MGRIGLQRALIGDQINRAALIKKARLSNRNRKMLGTGDGPTWTKTTDKACKENENKAKKIVFIEAYYYLEIICLSITESLRKKKFSLRILNPMKFENLFRLLLFFSLCVEGSCSSFFLKSTPEMEVGKWTYGKPTLHFPEIGSIKIGNYCSIAPGVEIIIRGDHNIDWVTTFPFMSFTDKGWPQARDFPGHPKSKGGVTIGNDVWIGLGALILSGVTIGDGAVIGAHAVVTKSVPPYAVVAGNPARILRIPL